MPPGSDQLDKKSFVLGNEKLWTVYRDEVWEWEPHAAGHEQEVQPLTVKIFLWSKDFDYRKEYPPELKVTGRRLDGYAPALLTLRPTNALALLPPCCQVFMYPLQAAGRSRMNTRARS